MTPKQHRWYLREWGRAFSAHWSGSRSGEVLARPGRGPSDLRDAIIGIAGRLAAQSEDGRLSADCIRHACHVRALGKDKGSWSLSNKDLDRVVAVFRLLADELDLKSRLAMDRTDAADSTGEVTADRTRMLYSVQHVDLPQDYVAEILRDKFGTPDARSLSDADLRQAVMTLKARAAARMVGRSKRAATLAPSAS